MKDRPILFSGPMVRAILEGRKTQTRRVVKPQPIPYGEASPYAMATQREHIGKPWMPVGGVFQSQWECPFGQPGDRLWVRETFGFSHQCDDVNAVERVVAYAAGEPFHITDAGVDSLKRCLDGSLMQPNHYVSRPDRWRPSIHMPRWASRLTLEITAVWVERLLHIGRGDAMAEGCPFQNMADGPDPRAWFADLWRSIYGHESWDANPWVWVVEFRKVEGKQ